MVPASLTIYASFVCVARMPTGYPVERQSNGAFKWMIDGQNLVQFKNIIYPTTLQVCVEHSKFSQVTFTKISW